MASRVTRGQHYLGETKKQLREGYGMYKYSNAYFKYEGEWKEGKKHGHGKLLMADGGFYEGEFINGEIEGHGFRKWAVSGNTYSGQFESGEMTGFGVLTCPDGTVYEGEFQNNMKEGHGILKYSNGDVYEGAFHKNKRHGGGSQTYANGDYFVGDWVFDKRQGSGELRFADGSIYEGQWRNDIFNGEGTLIHASGMTYEGIWINGKPKHEAKEMTIVGKTSYELTQGTPFDIHVEIRQEDGELVDFDMGRELKITAGFRHYTPTEGMQLLDMIEDIEETPLQTPFGYEIVMYPITVQSFLEDKLAQGDLGILGPRPATAATDDSTEFNLEEAPQILVKVDEPQVESTHKDGLNEVTKETLLNDAADAMATIELKEQETEATFQDSVPSPRQHAYEENILETPVLPPVTNQRTDNGRASFKNLVLPGSPPGYLPFTYLDAEEDGKQKASNYAIKQRAAAKAQLAPPGGSQQRLRKNSQSHQEGAPEGYRTFQVLDALLDEEARNKSRNQKTGRLAGQLGLGAKLGKTADEIPDSLIASKIDPKTQQIKRERRYGDERFARPGDYVIMIEDVTMPPFLGANLEPVFMLVKVNHQKKLKKVKSPKSTKHRMTSDKE